MATYHYDWFSNNIPIWSKILAEFKGRPIDVLEIGCFEGRATLWLLENILTHEKAYIDVIDTFQGSFEHQGRVDFSDTQAIFTENIKPYKEKVTVHWGFSNAVLPILCTEKKCFDLIYIDGSHQAQDVLSDAIFAHILLQRGGILIFDDLEWNAYPDPHMNPKLGIEAFLSVFLPYYTVLHRGYQLILRKDKV